MTALSQLPDEARIWLFGADRPLSESEVEALDRDLGAFMGAWAAHGSRLATAHAILEERFVVVAVDERAAGASGCSIDTMVRHLHTLEDRLGVGLVDSTPIWYRDPSGEIRSTSREAFRTGAAEGSITPDTTVFDLTVSTLGDLRGGEFERPVSESWHARLLPSASHAERS